MPTIEQSRRRFRFSVRALLLVVAIVGLGLTWLHSARDQQRVADGVRQSNTSAVLLYDYEVAADGRLNPSPEPPGPKWLRDRTGADYFASIVGAELFYATDADLARLARLPNLRRLNLVRSVDVTDAGLEHLEKLRHLKLLVLDDADQVTDRGLRSLGRLKNLKLLRLDPGRRMTSAGIEQLKRDLPHCRIEIDGLEESHRGLADSRMGRRPLTH